MKKTLLIIISILMPLLALATDSWPGKCDSLKISYELTSDPLEPSNPLKFLMKVRIKNEATTDLGTYCDVYNLVTSPDVSIVNNGSCYGNLEAGMSKIIDIKVTRANVSISHFNLFFKVKHGLDDTKYCSETKTHWFNAPIGIEEIDRSEMDYTLSYFDLMGREVSQPTINGFYIIEKLFEDGYKAIEKVYLTQAL